MGADQRPVTVDPSFSKDAARIYISQKTDIDDNFKIKQGNVGKAKARSAIGMKADWESQSKISYWHEGRRDKDYFKRWRYKASDRS